MKSKFTALKVVFGDELLLMLIATSLLVVIVALLPSNVLRIIFGLPFILLFPGYAVTAALFPRRESIGGIERAALSFGLSIAVVPLVGLVLNYTPWGIKLYPILIALALFVFVTSAVAWYRRLSLPASERFRLSFRIPLPSWRGQSTLDRALSVLLAVAVLGAVGTLGYVVAAPQVGERFSEFYVLGLEGKTEWYPSLFLMDGGRVVLVRYGGLETRDVEEQRARVTLGIYNHEHETASYRVEATIDGQEVPIWLDGVERDALEMTLDQGERWEREIGFAPTHLGDSQKVEFVLYRNDQPYFETPPHLWISVESIGSG